MAPRGSGTPNRLKLIICAFCLFLSICGLLLTIISIYFKLVEHITLINYILLLAFSILDHVEALGFLIKIIIGIGLILTFIGCVGVSAMHYEAKALFSIFFVTTFVTFLIQMGAGITLLNQEKRVSHNLGKRLNHGNTSEIPTRFSSYVPNYAEEKVQESFCCYWNSIGYNDSRICYPSEENNVMLTLDQFHFKRDSFCIFKIWNSSRAWLRFIGSFVVFVCIIEFLTLTGFCCTFLLFPGSEQRKEARALRNPRHQILITTTTEL